MWLTCRNYFGNVLSFYYYFLIIKITLITAYEAYEKDLTIVKLTAVILGPICGSQLMVSTPLPSWRLDVVKL